MVRTEEKLGGKKIGESHIRNFGRQKIWRRASVLQKCRRDNLEGWREKLWRIFTDSPKFFTAKFFFRTVLYLLRNQIRFMLAITYV